MLHKTTRMRGFHLFANDGEIGHVDDFLVDENWRIRYLVADTSNWVGGKAVLIPSVAIEKVDSPNRAIHVSMSREDIKLCPPVDSADIELIETLPPAII